MATTLSRSVLTRKFGIDEGGNKFLSTNTMNDPQNKNQANQNEADELGEVSFALADIKAKYDNIKKLADHKQEQLQSVRQDVDALQTQMDKSEGPTAALNMQLETLREELATSKYKKMEEQFTRDQNLHVIARLKQDHLAEQIKTANCSKSLANKKKVFDVEERRSRSVKQQKLESKLIVDRLMQNIEKEHHDTQQILSEIQKSIRNKEESVRRRIERQKKNQEIAEAAANESKDQSEAEMRDKLYIQKMWSSFMRKKMDNEMSKSAQIDEAFKQIKTATGVTNVQELVQRFLTREQTYSQLLQSVSDADKKTEQLKRDNEYLSGRLHELKIAATGGGPDQEEDDKKFADDEEIVEMRQRIGQQEKEFLTMQERYRKINLVNDQVSGWSRRVCQKFAAMLEERSLAQEDDLVKVFEKMESITVGELQSIRDKQEDNPLEPDDAFIDFATEDFINKNIRVRPISGTTNLGQQDRQSQISKNTANQDNEEAIESYQRLAEFEMENQRKLVKQKAAVYQEELRRKQALEEKKAQRK